MKIDYSKIEEEVIPHFKGGELSTAIKMFVDGSNRILKGRLEPGASIGLHTHENNCEMILITKGCGSVWDDGEIVPLATGDVNYCQKGHSHSLINNSDDDLEFFAVVAG